MSGKPTIDDVARVAGVSRATVSRVMNDAPGASEASRARVHASVAELGYLPNQTARALASGRSRTLDVVAITGKAATGGTAAGWMGSHPYWSRIFAGMMSVLENTDVQMRFHAVAPEPAAIDAIAARTTVGAIITIGPPELAARFHRRCPRVVSLVATAASVPSVEGDNAGGAYEAVKHLHALGRRRIAAVHGPDDNPCAIERRKGFRRAVRELGIEEIGAQGDFLRESGTAAAAGLLDRHPDVDAFVVACDLMAAGVVQAVTASGRTVPGDVSVVGFDDSIAAICTNPPLTTMRMPVEEMAATATRLLLDGPIPAGHRHTFPVHLITRESASLLGTP